MVVQEGPAKTNHSKMEDKRPEEEEVGGAMEGRGPVGRNMLQEAANHRSHRHLQLITIISITTTTIIIVERMVARAQSRRHRCVLCVCVFACARSLAKVRKDALLFQEKPAQKQVQLFSHLPQFERDKTLSRTLEYVATHKYPLERSRFTL